MRAFKFFALAPSTRMHFAAMPAGAILEFGVGLRETGCPIPIFWSPWRSTILSDGIDSLFKILELLLDHCFDGVDMCNLLHGMYRVLGSML